MTSDRQTSDTDAPVETASAIEERLAAILDHAADALIVTNDRGVIEDCNLAAARLFGWEPHELHGQRLEVLMPPAEQAVHAGHVDSYLQTGVSGILNVAPRPLEGRRKNGAPVAIELSVGEAFVGGERKFIGACRDISLRIANETALAETVAALGRTIADLKASSAELERERRQSEALARTAQSAQAEAEAANLAKSRFLATMSHELRTPLNGVIAIADVLAGRVTPGENADLVDIIRHSSRTLLALLNEILDLAKIEAGAFVLTPAPFSLSALLDQVGLAWRSVAAAKGLELRVLARDLPDVVGDEGRLRQVIANLLSNAIKFTERGTVTLRCDCRTLETGMARIELCVADTGRGFDAEFATKMFEPFIQGDSTNTRTAGGTGLGLAICRELVDLMGGEIMADGAPGQGARVTIRVDLPCAAPLDAKPALAAPPASSSPLEGRRILVAEDHPLNRRIMGILLDGLGLQYAMVEDGAAAVEAAAAEPFDLVLMDLQMPKMDGLEATRAIRRLPGPRAQIPIIAVTADAMSSHTDACQAAGMDGFLTKPIEPLALQEALLEHLLGDPPPSAASAHA